MKFSLIISFSVKKNRKHDMEVLEEKYQTLLNEMDVNLQKQLNETREQFQKQINDYAKQSVKHKNYFKYECSELFLSRLNIIIN